MAGMAPWTLSLICALAPAAVVAQPARVTKFDGGYFTGSIMISEPGDAPGSGEQIALFFDPSRTKIRPFALGKATSVGILEAIAADHEKLQHGMALSWPLSQNLEIAGKMASEMLHIIVYPKSGTAIDVPDIQKVRAYQPGAFKFLKEVKQRFGEPGEQQLWSMKTAQALGLNGTVHWWGTVGVAAAGDGSLTHVLLRAGPEK